MIKPTFNNNKMGIDDAEDDEDDPLSDENEEKKQGHDEDENVRDDDNESVGDTRASNASQKKNLKEVARKLWLAVEVGDKLATLKIL